MNGVRNLACGLLCFAAFAAASVVRADNAIRVTSPGFFIFLH